MNRNIGITGNIGFRMALCAMNDAIHLHTQTIEEPKKFTRTPKNIPFKSNSTPFIFEINEPNKVVQGKSHHKKSHKPNTGFTLGSYKYKSKRK